MRKSLFSRTRYREGRKFRKKRIFNYRFVSRVIGVLCLIQVTALLLTLAVSAHYRDSGLVPISITTGIMALVGGILMLVGRNSGEIETGRRESYVTVTLSWFVVSLIGMLPYYLSGAAETLPDALFETISGYTTTGASVLSNIESLPKSLLFWRSITQWQGGIGIIVFLVAFIPMTGESATMVYNSETTGVTHDRFLPRVGNMAKWIIIIYFVLTAMCAVLLALGKMDVFDAVCHAFSCLSTGGFSTKSNSLAFWDSYSINLTLDIFMFVGATNFTLIYLAISKKDPSQIFKDSEFRWFVTLTALFCIVGTIGFFLQGPSQGEPVMRSISRAVTQVISLATTTGYATGDYNYWGPLFIHVITMAMFVAGCSGSTSGGLKVVRFEIMIKSLSNELLRRTHPNVIRSVRISGHALNNDLVLSTMNFFVAYLSIILLGAIAVTLDGCGFMESVNIAISCISNSGGSIGTIGPMIGLGALSGWDKVILSIIMILGRLEIFTVLSILHPGFWRN